MKIIKKWLLILTMMVGLVSIFNPQTGEFHQYIVDGAPSEIHIQVPVGQ